MPKWVIAFVVIALIGLAWYRYQMAYETWGYHVRSYFDVMPATDTALKEWLAAQPGVSSVTVAREGRSF